MHRSLFTRIVSALFAFWFAVFTAEPVALHTCPVHDGAGVASHGGHAASASTHQMAAMDHGAPESSDAAGHGRLPGHGGKKVCQCPGSCCTVAPFALRAIPGIDVPAELELADSGLPAYEYVAVSRSVLLPFANGPPTARV
jgi:hypothetical protein